MMLSNKRIKQEIEALKATDEKLRQILKDAESGLLINEIVLKAFESKLK